MGGGAAEDSDSECPGPDGAHGQPRLRGIPRSEEHTSELQSLRHLVCRLLLRRPAVPTLFPYTTLFRSKWVAAPQKIPILNVLGQTEPMDSPGYAVFLDRKSTRLNSSHLGISYAVFCCGDLQFLHSFPTRRSSDLNGWRRRRRFRF